MRAPSQSVLVLAILFALVPIQANAQGCTQCRDNTAATSPATQRAYRNAILLLSVAGGGIFVGTVFLFKRHL